MAKSGDLEANIHLLVVDDQPPVAGILASALEGEGHVVRTAESGEEALRLMEQALPDAVFLDIVMPGMDGIELLRRIRRLYGELPVVVLSGWATDEQLRIAVELSVADIVHKPDVLKNLPEALAQIEARRTDARRPSDGRTSQTPKAR
ncbi:MAG: response regulator [Candidatus Rokuibacteriota bacterium]